MRDHLVGDLVYSTEGSPFDRFATVGRIASVDQCSSSITVERADGVTAYTSACSYQPVEPKHIAWLSVFDTVARTPLVRVILVAADVNEEQLLKSMHVAMEDVHEAIQLRLTEGAILQKAWESRWKGSIRIQKVTVDQLHCSLDNARELDVVRGGHRPFIGILGPTTEENITKCLGPAIAEDSDEDDE
jgi:hypothetical protein